MAMPPSRTIAQRLRHFRVLRGFSQRELAARLGVPRTYVSKLENGRAVPTPGVIYRLAAALDVPATHMVDDGQGLTGFLLADPLVRDVEELLRGVKPSRLAELETRLQMFFGRGLPA